MITVNEILSWSDVDDGHGDRSIIPQLAVPVGDLHRAARFYERVFGFYRVFVARGNTDGPLVRTTVSGVRLVLHAAPMNDGSNLLRRWAFAVKNLDDVRARIWDLGVKVARDSGAPDHVYRRLGGGSLYVHDRDGNEIELVELAPRTRLAQASAHRFALEHALGARAHS